MEWLATSLVSAVRVAGAEVLLGLVACRCPAASQLPALGDRVHSQSEIEGVLYVVVTVNILQNAVFLLPIESWRLLVRKQGLSVFSDVDRVRGGHPRRLAGTHGLHTRGCHQTILQLVGHLPVGGAFQRLGFSEYLNTGAGVRAGAGVVPGPGRKRRLETVLVLAARRGHTLAGLEVSVLSPAKLEAHIWAR